MFFQTLFQDVLVKPKQETQNFQFAKQSSVNKYKTLKYISFPLNKLSII